MKLKIVMCSLLSISAYAGTMGEIQEVNAFPYVATFSIGPVWTNPGVDGGIKARKYGAALC